jgi:hypothetical protein
MPYNSVATVRRNQEFPSSRHSSSWLLEQPLSSLHFTPSHDTSFSAETQHEDSPVTGQPPFFQFDHWQFTILPAVLPAVFARIQFCLRSHIGPIFCALVPALPQLSHITPTGQRNEPFWCGFHSRDHEEMNTWLRAGPHTRPPAST